MRRRGPALLAVLLVGCATMLSPSQRQDLETRTYKAAYSETFAACRDAFVNYGYVIEDSDYQGGILAVSSEERIHNPNMALGLSVIPPAGDFYMQRYGWALFDLLTIPFSLLWAMPSNYHLARTRMKEIEGTVSLKELKEDRTRVRITLSGVEWDAENYPRTIRSLQEEIERQLFVGEGELFDEP